jgi:hypothetical protein
VRASARCHPDVLSDATSIYPSGMSEPAENSDGT